MYFLIYYLFVNDKISWGGIKYSFEKIRRDGGGVRKHMRVTNMILCDTFYFRYTSQSSPTTTTTVDNTPTTIGNSFYVRCETKLCKSSKNQNY